MRIYVHDGLRHRSLTGYGALARHLTLGLHELGHEVIRQDGDRAWDQIEPGNAERLQGLPAAAAPPDADLVLQIGSPAASRQFRSPSLIYTQNALGGLRREWVEALHRADGCIVPGQYDLEVFARELPNVHVAPQGSNPAVFRPVPEWRPEGSDRFTFLFVGSFSYRKGVDLLLAAYLDEFSEREPVELWLLCTGMGDEFNYLLRDIQAHRPLAHVRMLTRPQSPPWMCRTYNRVDCIVTMSRGEGWCMPLTEALLCGKPVVAPNSTGMAEYLNDELGYLLPTRELEVLALGDDDPFAAGFRNAYGEPGITYHEPDAAAARAAMRSAYANQSEAVEKGAKGREVILERFNWRTAAEGVSRACEAACSPTPP